jgi:hypothetical protein
MHARIAMRRAAISVTSVLFLTGFAWTASAAPIDLENSVDVGWSDVPCIPTPSLCSITGGMPVLVFGAPRFVPDARNVRDLLNVYVDFYSVSFTTPNPGESNTLFLNVGDSALNEVLLPDNTALRLSYAFPEPVAGFVPATDVGLTLLNFEGSALLPPGDLFFTVDFNPRMGLTETGPDRPAQAAIITLSGPGIVVPEPASFVLLLSGLTSVGLGVGWRRIRRRASHPIG